LILILNIEDIIRHWFCVQPSILASVGGMGVIGVYGCWRWLVGHLLEGGVIDLCNGLSLLVYMGWWDGGNGWSWEGVIGVWLAVVWEWLLEMACWASVGRSHRCMVGAGMGVVVGDGLLGIY
jgi:hypothetical protein